MSPALEARGLSARLDGVLIVDGVDLVAEAGRITVIVGPNGAGKSTLFDCLSGVGRVAAGSVWHRGEEVTDLQFDAKARRGLARTFQRSSLFPTMTVAENLLVAAESHHRRGILRGVIGRAAPQRWRHRAAVRDVLEDLGLSRLADVTAGELPSGTVHLVELARALCTGPDTLLLDEPASGLDDAEAERLHQLLHRLAARDLAVVMIEHDLTLVDETADVVYVMAGGRMVVSGTAGEVLQRPDVSSLLFGRPS
jgi:branched-chain amino acid transport system ATP-binding protein